MEQFPASAAEKSTEKQGANKKMAADDFLLLQSFSPNTSPFLKVLDFICVCCTNLHTSECILYVPVCELLLSFFFLQHHMVIDITMTTESRWLSVMSGTTLPTWEAQ